MAVTSPREAVLGVDVGTGSLKAGLFALDGTPLGISRAAYSTLSTEGDAREQDPRDWWTALSQVCHTLLDASAHGDRDVHVLAVAIGGQAPSLVPLDEAFEPTHPAITWLDPRPSAEAERLYAQIGEPVPVWGSWPAQAAWFIHNRPEALRRTRWLLGCPDYLTARLMCAPASLLSATEQELALTGIEPRMVPPAWTPGAVIGAVSPAAARDTHLPVGTPVVGGHVDGLLGVLGSGVRRPGDGTVNCGTSGTFSIVAEPPMGFPMFGLHVAGTATNAGAALDWFAQNIAGTSGDDPDLFASAARIAPGSEGLLFLPHLAGERGTTHDAYARGAWVGLTLAHTRAHLTRSLLEGVAFSFRAMQDWLEASGAPVHDVRCVGGQAHSDIWNQIKADILNRVVYVPRVVDAVVVGAASLAALGIGAHPDLPSAVDAMVHVERQFVPDPDRVKRYAELFEVYQGVYPALRETSWRLHDLARRS